MDIIVIHPPLWKFFLVKKGGVNICVTGKLKKNRRKKGGVNKGVTGSLKKIKADKKGGGELRRDKLPKKNRRQKRGEW